MKGTGLLLVGAVGAAAVFLLAGSTSTSPTAPNEGATQLLPFDPSKAPDVNDNPPVPTGYRYMQQSEVTPEMTAWAVQLLNDPTNSPMFSAAARDFNGFPVLAITEWHPPDFIKGYIHRGVTLLTQA